MPDKIRISILPGGLVKVETDCIPGANHVSPAGILIAYGPTVLVVCAAEFDSRSCALCDCAAWPGHSATSRKIPTSTG
jgi:hypothetical protein